MRCPLPPADPGWVNKNLTGLLGGLSYAAAAFLVSHGPSGGDVTSVRLWGVALGGLIASLAARRHASRLTRRGRTAEPFASVIAGWTAALLVDFAAFAVFAGLIVPVLPGM
jgi:hypothetical protein